MKLDEIEDVVIETSMKPWIVGNGDHGEKWIITEGSRHAKLDDSWLPNEDVEDAVFVMNNVRYLLGIAKAARDVMRNHPTDYHALDCKCSRCKLREAFRE